MTTTTTTTHDNDNDDDSRRSICDHASAGNPGPLSKVPGQVPHALNYTDGTLRQGDLIPPPSQIGGRAINEPEATLFGNQLGTRPDAAKLSLTLSNPSKEDQPKGLEPDNQRTGKKEAEETLNSSAAASLNSGNSCMGNTVTVETTATQTDVVLPQRVDAYRHCCLLSTTVIDKPRTTAEVM